MKISKLVAALVATVVFTSVQADHAAVLYCAIDSKNKVRVLAADSPASSHVMTSAKRGSGCAQALHEFMAKGYAITNAFSASTWRSGLLGSPLRIEGVIEEKAEKTDRKHAKVELDVNWEPVKSGQVRADRVLEESTAVTVFVLTHHTN